MKNKAHLELFKAKLTAHLKAKAKSKEIEQSILQIKHQNKLESSNVSLEVILNIMTF